MDGENKQDEYSSLFPKLLKKIQIVSDAIKGIEKDMKVGTGNYSYQAVSDSNVTLRVKEAEKEAGIISIPIKQELIKSEILRTNKKESSSSEVTESIKYVDLIKMTLRIFDVDTGIYLDVESLGRGLDSGDKGFGKASTYARKYALLNAYKIATGEDPDSEMSKKETATSKDEKRIKIVDYLRQNNEYCLEITKHFNLTSLDDLTESHVNKIHTNLTKKNLI